MKKVIIRTIRLQCMFLLIVAAAVIIFPGAQKVSAKEVQKLPYLIKVNRACNTITIYEKDGDGKYTAPIKAMACSVGKGTRTITGNFQTKAKYRWKELMGDVWGQYATRIVGGILFHSVYYYENGNPATLATNEFNKLGTAASHGCIRLTVVDAKWIYDNCSVGTTVIIYDDKKNPGPLGKPETITLPSKVRWDPTDPSEKNPYKDKVPKITGAKDLTVTWGEEVNLLTGVKAKSTFGTDITSALIVEGEVDFNKPGKYQITYCVKDELGKEARKTVTVKINVNLFDLVLEGISDKVVNGTVVMDEAFALSGVDAYYLGIKLVKDYIKVSIEEISTNEYSINYQVIIGEEATAAVNASVYIDNEAPIIYGISDLQLEAGEVPSEGNLLEGVTANDNYSKPENIQISITVNENPDGTYLVTYIATDEAGNSSNEQVTIHSANEQATINN